MWLMMRRILSGRPNRRNAVIMAPTLIESNAFAQSSASIAVRPHRCASAKSMCLRTAQIASAVPRPRLKPNCVEVSRSYAPAACKRFNSNDANNLYANFVFASNVPEYYATRTIVHDKPSLHAPANASFVLFAVSWNRGFVVSMQILFCSLRS